MKRSWLPVGLLLLVAVGCSVASKGGADPTAAEKPAATAVPSTPTLVMKPVEPTAPPATPTQEAELSRQEPEIPPGVIAGVVNNAEGPVGGAIVRVRSTDYQTTSDGSGAFTLRGLPMTAPISVTAWAEGHYNGAVSVVPGLGPVTITLEYLHTTDNLEYEFATAETCAECHGIGPYPEWAADAHAQSAVNPRFISMYEGTDVHGNKSPSSYDASGRPMSPDLTQPYYGPGYRLDYRDRAGNCATCHTPLADDLKPSNTCGWSGCHSEFTASMSDVVPPGIYPTGLEGIAAEGINCDFCHKVGDVVLNPDTGLPSGARPGINSMLLYRPDEGEDLFFGPLDDVPLPDSYLPLQQESTYCAACHYGVFGGVVGHKDMVGGVKIYNSFGEWLESPYSDPETGQTCQDCHMPTVDYEYFVYPEKGGMPRDPDSIRSHLMLGALDEEFLQNAVTMTTTARWEGEVVRVEVSIKNDKTGHHVPTDSPLRHMILVVSATDGEGNRLPLNAGPILPDWTGDYAGQPGRYFAKILEDEWTGESPTAAYWRDIRLMEDTRIAAMATDVSAYTFATPDSGPITVEARLLFRRAFQQLMEWKGWDDPDILMEEATIVLPGH